MKIQLKRSNVLNGSNAKEPTAEQMEYGELAVNYNPNDPAIFLKDGNNSIQRIAGRGSVGIPDLDNANQQPGTLDDRYVNLTGDSMTGNLQLPGGGNNTEALQKQEVETLINNSDTGAGKYVEIAGDSMTGNLQLPGGGSNNDALQKQEVVTLINNSDTGAGKYVEVAGDNMTGDLTLGTNKITLDATGGSATFAGNVGIGTTGAQTALHVFSTNTITTSPASSSANQIRLGNDDTTTLLGVSASAAHISAYDTANFSNTKNLVLNQNGGKVGIGTDDPQALLEIGATDNSIQLTGADLKFTRNNSYIAHNGTGSLRIRDKDLIDYIVFDYNSGANRLTLLGEDRIQMNTGGTERLRINSSGNVGIGTDNPISKFHVADDGGADLRLQDSTSTSATASVLIKAIGSTEMRLQASGGTTAKAMTFYRSSNTEAMVINADGNVGIGTSIPQAKLDVDNGAPSGTLPTLGGLLVTNGGTAASTAAVCVATGSGPIFNVMNNGNVGIGKINPQAKLDVNGEIRTGAWDRSLTNVEGVSMNQYGRISCQKQNDGVVFEGYKGNQETSTISANGNATFAGNVLIGGTLLDVNGGIKVSGGTIDLTSANGEIAYGTDPAGFANTLQIKGADTGQWLRFYAGGLQVFGENTRTGFACGGLFANTKYSSSNTGHQAFVDNCDYTDALGTVNKVGFYAFPRNLTFSPGDTGSYKSFLANAPQDVTSGSNLSYNFYAAGSAPNYFAGNVGIGWGKLLVGTPSALMIPDGETGTQRDAQMSLAGNTFKSTIQSNSFFNTTAVNGAGAYSFTRSNNSTVGSHAVVGSGNVLGTLQWSGSDGTNYIRAAYIRAEVDGTPGANDMPGRLVFSTTADGASSPTERIRINSAGHVGIGTNDPQAKLDVNGEIRTGAWDRSLTNVEGVSMNQYGRISCQKQADGVVFEGYKGNQETSTISANGNATFAGTVTATVVPPSDARFKENITPAKPQLADVVALGGILKNYDWNEDAPLTEELRSVRQLGLIAQEAAEICPSITKDIHRIKQGEIITPEKIIPAVYEENIVPAEYKTIIIPAQNDEEGREITPASTEEVLVTPEYIDKVLITEEQVMPATYEELDDSYKGISQEALIMKLIGAVAELSAQVQELSKNA